MALGVDLSILNQKGTPAFFSDIFANRPAFGFAGRVFISTDTGAIYEDTGTAWTLIADAGAGTTGTLQQVTTNGNTTTQGISITAGGLNANTVSVIGGTSSQFLKANGTLDSATYALDSTVVHLAGTETITGLKTITGGLICTPAPQLNGGVYLKEGVFSSASGFTGLMGNTDGIRVMLGNGVGYHYLHFPTATANDYTYPATSGTLGLSTAALTAGSVVFAGSGGVLSQDNTNFFWDDTNNFLGIGNTGTPTAPLDIHNGTVGQLIQLNATSTNNSNIGFLNGSVGKWRIGNVYNAGANDFNLYNIGLAAIALSFLSATSAATFASSVTSTRFVLSGATASSGLYYESAANRVTVANYTAAGIVDIEVNGGSSAATFNADLSTTFKGAISGTSATFTSSSATSTVTKFSATNYGNLGTTYIQIGSQYDDGSSRIGSVNPTGNTSSLFFEVHNATTGVWNTALTIASTGAATFSASVGINGVGATYPLYVRTGTNQRARFVDSTGTFQMSVLNDAESGYSDMEFGNTALTIKASGNIGIGGADSIVKLNIVGAGATSATYGIYITNSTPANTFAVRNDGAVFLKAAYPFTTAAVPNMVLDASGVIQLSVSSLKYKINVIDYNKGLDYVLKLRPVSYKSKNSITDGDKIFAGFIAEEIDELGLNEFVVYAKDGTPNALAYQNMVTLLTKAIQELNEKLVRNNIN
jgi:hypothetical protein